MQNNDIWDEIEKRGHGESLSEEMFEFLSVYADGECAPKERRLVEAYLTESAEARDVLADLRRQGAFMAEGAQEPPSGLKEAILLATTRKRRLAWPTVAGFAGAAAAAAMTLLILAPHNEAGKPALVATRTVEAPAPKPYVPAPTLPENPTMEGTIVAEAPKRSLHKQSTTIAAVYTPPTVEPPKVVKSLVASKPRTGHIAGASGGSIQPPPTYTTATEDYGKRADLTSPDVVAMTSAANEETPAQPVIEAKKDDSKVLPDAREKLRDRLKLLNQGSKDIKEAVRSNQP